MDIGIIGLGVMGSATGRHLLAGGHRVHGYDIDPAKRNAFDDLGGVTADSAAGVGSAAEIVLTWLPSVEALDQTASDLAGSMGPGSLVVEMGTLPLAAKRAVRDRLARASIDMMDAPVSGTGQQAEDATLVVYASGSEQAYGRAEPLFDLLGSGRYLGAFGNGSVMKYIANLLVTIHTLAAAEAHAMGAAAGMDAAVVQQVISDGVGASRMWDIRGAMMATGTYEPPAGRLDIIKKDAGIIADYADQVGTPIPLLSVALDLFRRASDDGLGDLDAAAIRVFLDRL